MGCTNRTLNYNYTAMSRSRSLRTLYILKNVKLSKKLFNDPASGSTDEKYINTSFLQFTDSFSQKCKGGRSSREPFTRFASCHARSSSTPNQLSNDTKQSVYKCVYVDDPLDNVKV